MSVVGGITEAISSYIFDTRVLANHIIGLGLFLGLVIQHGIPLRRLVRPLIWAEVVTLTLWWVIPDTWWVIPALAFWIHRYEDFIGPRVKIHKNAIFRSSQETCKLLLNGGRSLDVQSWSDDSYPDGLLLATSLQYAQRWTSFWHWTLGKDALDIRHIQTVDEGPDTLTAKATTDAGAEPSQCFHVGVRNLVITYIAESTEARDLWLDGFRRVVGDQLQKYKEKWMNNLLNECQQLSSDGKNLTLDQSLEILTKLNRNFDKPYAKELFNTFAKITNKKNRFGDLLLNRDLFSKFVDVSTKRPDIQQLYERLLHKRKGDVSLSASHLQEFMQEDQKEKVSINVCNQWIKEHEPILPNNLSSFGFTSFMLSKEQSIFNRSHTKVYQDMTHPLSHYFIATSHNTYCTKDQLKGKSSVDAYISAFKRGCKCVELDCWDGPNNEPIIYHGHTLTSKILYRDVVQAIADYAFIVSDYPVILSFENHCSVEQQRVMANHLQNILGDKLHVDPPPEGQTDLPSPEDLKGKVLVKAKKLKEEGDDDDFDDYSDDDDDIEDITPSEDMKPRNLDNRKNSDEFDKDDFRRSSLASIGSSLNSSIKSYLSMGSESPIIEETTETNGNINGDAAETNGNGTTPHADDNTNPLLKRTSTKKSRTDSKKKKALKIAQELSDLVTYCQAVRFKGFEYARIHQFHYEMSSFGEKKSSKLAREETTGIIRFTRRQLSRIYPAGHRVDSSNYDPQMVWNVGCQLVALNYQTPGRPMQINQGLFRDNGGCGYVLKPSCLIQDNCTFDPKGPFGEHTAKFLMIRIISGLQLPYVKEDRVKSERSLYVQIKIGGVEADCKKDKTKVVKNNGYNPVWNEMLGFKIHAPDLCLVSFTVKEGDTFLAQFTLPFNSIQQGYRRVPLETKSSEPLQNASLFVHVEVKDSVL